MEEHLRPESQGVACLLCVSKGLLLHKRHLSLVVAFVFYMFSKRLQIVMDDNRLLAFFNSFTCYVGSNKHIGLYLLFSFYAIVYLNSNLEPL